MFWNTQRDKQVLLISNAGTGLVNPILQGVPIIVSARFRQDVESVSGLIGTSYPPATTFSFTQDDNDTLLWKHSAVAGTSPFIVSSSPLDVRAIFTSSETCDTTIWDKKLYIQALPCHAVQVWSLDDGWTSINYTNDPSTVPVVCQMCAIRFFSGWYDDFRIPRYGGIQTVSAYDYGTSESDLSEEDIHRHVDEDISRMNYVYLNKNLTGIVETHEFTLAFKASETVAQTVRCMVQTKACLGINIQDPVTT